MTTFSERRTVMVDTQVRPSDVTKFPIIAAMLDVPREAFVPASRRDAAYMGEHVPLAPGRVVLDPRCFSKMLDALDIGPEAVVALEADEAMARDAEAALSAVGADNVAVVTGPLQNGAAKHGPYDVIVVEGGVEQWPATLTAQLKDGGRCAAIFIEGGLGTVRVGLKAGDAVSWRYAFNAAAPVLPGFAATPTFAL
jgi:protein-L-isoaspartate(D-aspartate) O-methyltransferase